MEFGFYGVAVGAVDALGEAWKARCVAWRCRTPLPVLSPRSRRV